MVGQERVPAAPVTLYPHEPGRRRAGSAAGRVDFSSYWDYIGLREGILPVPDVILSQFPSRRAYREFVDSYREQDTRMIEYLLFGED